MKKIAAFFTAFLLFLIVIVAFHFTVSGDLRMNNKAFGTWYNPYKDMSYQAIGQNMHKDTMLVFGSSEFKHGRKTKYHPMNLFKKEDISLMTVGGPFNQCLNHAITLGAVENKIKDRKVVLLLSYSWFFKDGIKPDNYSLRFSEGSYMAFMENKDIPLSIKKYVAARSEKLLVNNISKESSVRLIDRLKVRGGGNAIDRFVYNTKKTYVEDKDALTISGALKLAKIRKLKSYNDRFKNQEPLNWGALDRQAVLKDGKRSHNEFYMSDRLWDRKFEPKYYACNDLHATEDMVSSPEYGDLECFLKVCKADKIQPMLVLLPLNGRWADYTGITLDKRIAYNNKVKALAKEYGAKVSDLSKYDYSPYVTLDAAHLWGKGWVHVNEEIYKFYKQS
jgi:D-alanine transfer protein